MVHTMLLVFLILFCFLMLCPLLSIRLWTVLQSAFLLFDWQEIDKSGNFKDLPYQLVGIGDLHTAFCAHGLVS